VSESLGVVRGSLIAPNPRDTDVQNAAETFRSSGSNVIVAVGGGSVMDAAKATALVSVHGGHIVQYDGVNTVPRGPVIPLLAIPTTSGTGSEVTPVAVITDTQNHIKIGVIDRYLLEPVRVLLEYLHYPVRDLPVIFHISRDSNLLVKES
jgi:alcohol dehydrogenase class IV